MMRSKYKYLDISILTFFLSYTLSYVFVVYTGVKIFPTIAKFLSLLILLVAYLKSKKYLTIRKNLTLVKTYSFSLILLCTIQFAIFKNVNGLQNLILGLLIFAFISSFSYRREAEIFSNSLKYSAIIAAFLSSVPNILHNDFTYYYRHEAIIEKPTCSLIFGMYFCSFIVDYYVKSKKGLRVIIPFIYVFLINLFIVQSKMSMIAFFIFIVVFYILNNDKKFRYRVKRLLLFTTIILGIIIVFFPSFSLLPDTWKILVNEITGTQYFKINRIIRDNDTYTMRAAIRAFCYKLFLEHPIFGVGIGNYSLYAGYDVTFKTYKNYITINETESTFFSVMVEGGIWYIITYLSLFISIIYKLLVKIRNKIDEYDCYLALSICFPIFILCLGNDFMDSLFWVCIGFSYSISNTKV